MSDVKAVIDQYAAEAAQLRALLAEAQTVAVLCLAEYGKQAAKGGKIVLPVPASARKVAQTIDEVDFKWLAGDPRKGSLRIIGTFKKEGE